ncbi:DUF4199 domain-containing protein [uncultured Mucilaginibacter sp.]|uniref:DUF4199 domain-containing protein n=1 Tax=uncultured Mucilaginibacter sp. TaxID=797541 RepID=UPI0025CF10E2|nr:DUF4199 domain-containing protein [uncultured Mucilaginibacter sp.]
MKNAITFGLFIGILSGLWIFIIPKFGLTPQSGFMSPVEYCAGLIPLIGLYFGVRSYRNNDCKGKMGFLEGLIQAFKILLIGGVVAVAAAIVYVDEINRQDITDFSGRMFGALLVGLLLALGVAALFTTKHNKVD